MNYKVLIYIIIGTMLLIGTASAYSVTRITTNASDQTHPSIYNKYIVWQDARNGGSDIYLQNIGTKKQTRITKNVDAEKPCVSGNRIVWQDKRNGNWDIYMYDISTKKTSRITSNTADQTDPYVYGNLIVWADTRAGGSNIYMQDLGTHKQTKITATNNSYDPTIYNKKIVYIDDTDHMNSYDISTKKTNLVMSGEPFSLSLYGNRLIFNDMFTGLHTYMYDLSTKKYINLPFVFISNPSIYGNKIVYEEQKNIGGYDIYLAQI